MKKIENFVLLPNETFSQLLEQKSRVNQNPKKELLIVVEDFKDFLNDLPDKEILTFVYVSYPDYISESAKWDELKPERIKIAVSLLKKEKVSFGKAVEISGLSASRFEELLKKNNIKLKNDYKEITFEKN